MRTPIPTARRPQQHIHFTERVDTDTGERQPHCRVIDYCSQQCHDVAIGRGTLPDGSQIRFYPAASTDQIDSVKKRVVASLVSANRN